MPSINYCLVSREDYPDFRRISVDGDAMAEEYDDFVGKVILAEDSMKTRGISVATIYVKPEELLLWCKSRNRLVDGSARAEYVILQAIEMEKK